MRAIGIDIGGSSVKLALLNGETVEWTARSARYTKPSLPELVSAIKLLLEGKNLRAGAAGICLPGLYDSKQRFVVKSVNVPGLNGANLDELVSEVFGVTPPTIAVFTDALAAATDIVKSQKLSGRVIVISIGTGVGMSILDDGKPLLVDGNSSGHLGQIDVSLCESPPIGPDGGAGSLEAYLGAAALRMQYGEDSEAIVRGLTVNDLPLRALVRAIRICHGIYRPNHVVLAGGIGVHLAGVANDLKRAVDNNLTKIAHRNWTLRVASEVFHAARGAALLAIGGESHRCFTSHG